MAWVEHVPSSAFPPGEHVLRAIAPFEDTKNRQGEPAFRIRLVNQDGLPFTAFTSQRAGPRSSLRAICEAAAGTKLALGFDTDAAVGCPFRALVIVHPEHPNLRRIARVAAMDGTMEFALRANRDKTWLALAEEKGVPS